jgi:hypothetical protein
MVGEATGEAVSNIVEGAGFVAADVIVEISRVTRFMEAFGLIIALWLVFQVIALIVNRKKRKALYRVEDRLKVIERKLDKVLKGRKG